MSSAKALAVVGLSGALAVALVWWSLDAFGVRSPIFSLLANWIAMSWIAVAGQFVRLPLPPACYNSQAWEQGGRAYELLGVRAFKRIVRRGPLKAFSPTLKMPRERTAAALAALDGEMRKAEAGHLIILGLIILSAGSVLLFGFADAAAWLLLFAIPINVYPIMLQRYNRIKLQERIAALGTV